MSAVGFAHGYHAALLMPAFGFTLGYHAALLVSEVEVVFLLAVSVAIGIPLRSMACQVI